MAAVLFHTVIQSYIKNNRSAQKSHSIVKVQSSHDPCTFTIFLTHILFKMYTNTFPAHVKGLCMNVISAPI